MTEAAAIESGAVPPSVPDGRLRLLFRRTLAACFLGVGAYTCLTVLGAPAAYGEQPAAAIAEVGEPTQPEAETVSPGGSLGGGAESTAATQAADTPDSSGGEVSDNGDVPVAGDSAASSTATTEATAATAEPSAADALPTDAVPAEPAPTDAVPAEPVPTDAAAAEPTDPSATTSPAADASTTTTVLTVSRSTDDGTSSSTTGTASGSDEENAPVATGSSADRPATLVSGPVGICAPGSAVVTRAAGPTAQRSAARDASPAAGAQALRPSGTVGSFSAVQALPATGGIPSGATQPAPSHPLPDSPSADSGTAGCGSGAGGGSPRGGTGAAADLAPSVQIVPARHSGERIAPAAGSPTTTATDPATRPD